jgi:hypothetical protein
VIDIALNGDGDIDVSSYNMHVIDTDELIAQRLLVRLRAFRGEWYLDTTFGVPYYQDILVKNPDPSQLEAAFKSVIIGTPGVEKITEFEADIDSSRRLTVSFRATTDLGAIEIAEAL